MDDKRTTFTISALKAFLDSLEEGVLFLDGARRVVALNSAAERLLGRERTLLLDRLCPSLFPETECARQCEARAACSLTPAPQEGRKIQDIAFRRPDGSAVTLQMWAMLLPTNDARLHCSIVLRDRSREAALEAEVRERWQLGGLIGRSAPMQTLYDGILRAAASDAPVLLTGESGAGKELVARAVHDNSRRSRGPYVPLHCASLPENLLESELFGHAKGAFSGAGTVRVGRFEAAAGGTLLLDEIGEISPAMQTKLLRVLQEREIVRLGENHPRKVDVRVIAATHRDLADMVRRGEFRQDLYYRLRVLPLAVPALRERREDIALLASKLVAQLAERYERPALRISAPAMGVLESHGWPGNVRELFNALEFAVVHAEGRELLPRHLPPELCVGGVSASSAADAGQPMRGITGYYRPPGTREQEEALIRQVLAECQGNRTEAARRLGMSRTTLWKRLK